MTAKKSRWFVEVFLDGSTVRFWNGFEAITFDGETFDPLGDRFSPPDRVRLQSNLDSETIKLAFDSSRQTDNSDTLGALLDSNLRRRQIRLRNVYYTTSPDDGDVISDTYGRIRSTPDTISPGGEPQLDVEIESGSLVYLERRMQTRSPVNQKEAFPDDKGFDLAKVLEGQVLAWRTKTVKSGTVEVSATETDDYFARKLAIGEFATEGTFVAHFTGKQQKKNWFRVFAIADCRIEELNKVWINGNLQVNGALTHGVRTLVRLPNDKNENRCWITFYDGRHDQSADSELVTYASEWTSSHRLRGVAYVVIEHQWDDDLPEAFDYKFAGKGARFYDRRKDSTAGGTGSHRLDDPTTWEYSTNRMVVADHYRQGIRIMPSGFTTGGADPSIYWFGVGESADVIPYDEFEDLADLCDESVALKAGGTQKRYEVHGILSADDDHKKNLEKLASGMAARAIDQGGRIVFRPIRSQSVVMTLTDDDLSNTEDTVFDPTGRIDDMVNAVEGRFVDPDQNFASTDYPRVVNDTYVAEDGGDLIVGTENADMDISGERAQRVATLKLNFSRRVATLEEVFLSSKVRSLKPSDWFSRESSLRGIPSGKTFEVDEIERRKDGTTKILAFEVDPEVDAWEASNAVDLSVPPSIPASTIIDLTTPSITITPFSYTGGGAEVPAVRLVNADYSDFIGDEIVGEFGLHDGSGGITGESATVTFPGNIETLEGLIGLPPSTTFAIRFQSRKGERVSAWSSFQTFTTTSVYRSGTSGIADSFVGQGALATEDQADWASQVTGTGKPEDDATKSRVFRQSSAPSSPNVNDIWVVLSGGVPVSVKAWDGSSWITGADLTSLNVAAGFVGQDWGATASQDDADNNRAKPNPNLIPNGGFEQGDLGWTLVYGAVANNVNGVYWYADAPADGTTVIGYSPFFDMVDTGSYSFSYEQSPTIAGSGKVRCDLECWDATTRLSREGLVASADGGWTRIRSEGISAPSGTTRGRLRWYFNSANAGDASRVRRVKVERNATATAYSFDRYLYDAGTHLATVEVGSNVTEDHTAAGIADQGSQATANHQRGASYVGTPTEGSWWADTSSDELKLYTGGAWNKVADITPTGIDAPFRAPITGTKSKTRGSVGTTTFTDIVITPQNGSGSYTYDWEHISGDDFGMTGAATNAPDFSIYVNGTDKVGIYQCVTTDNDTGEAVVSRLGLVVTWTG